MIKFTKVKGSPKVSVESVKNLLVDLESRLPIGENPKIEKKKKAKK